MLIDLLLASTLVTGGVPQDPQTSLRAVIHGGRALGDVLRAKGYDVVPLRERAAGSGSGLVFYGMPEELERLRADYPKLIVFAIEHGRPLRDVLAPVQAAGLDVPDSRYRTWTEINSDLQAVAAAYPAIAQRVNLTQRYGAPATEEGRDIFALKLSDNVAADEDEPAVLVVSNHHAREINTVELAFEVIDRLVANYGVSPQATQLLDEKVVWVVPTMNPDGLEHMWNVDNGWRKNRRDNGDGTFGVDLNRNYPYFWSQCGSSSNPNSNTYHGAAAASESETQTMLAFGRAERFERVWDQHSHARDVRWAYNPLTVGQIPVPVAAFYDGLQQQIAGAMNYSTNSSCCCGGHQHWHFAEHGALAYLTEMGTSFQPSWTSNQSELVRMWPGVERFLYEPTPLVGHLRSLAGGQPLEGQIRLPADPFVDGQARRSEGRFGRFSVWLAPGTHSLEFSAPGHESQQVTVVIQAGQTTLQDVVLVPALQPTTLTAHGVPCVGCSVQMVLTSPGDPGAEYYIGLSHADTPGIQVGPRTVPLAAGGLLDSIPLSPNVFQNFIGLLDGTGAATGTLRIPALPALLGFTVYCGAVTFAPGWPSQVKGISNGFSLTVQ